MTNVSVGFWPPWCWSPSGWDSRASPPAEISINLSKTFLRISWLKKLLWPESWRGALHIHLLSFPRFWTLFIERFWFLERRDNENQQFLDCMQSLFFLQLATCLRERRASKPRDARNEGGSPRRKESLSQGLFFVPFPSPVFSLARVHSRAFCSTD